MRIGTAGWSIPKPFADAFPGDGAHLERYARVLSGVEINSSFYRPHRRTTYERWAASVPATFRFAVKIPKAISHTQRLVGVDDLLDAFLGEVAGLGEKLAVLLLQLPPSFAYDEDVAAPFLANLRGRFADTVAIACEPRHASWFAAGADACLAEHHLARVAADPVLVPSGTLPGGWSGFRYRRLHGAPRIYYSDYGEAYLKTLAATLRDEDERSWCIFDNTASGAATGDALALRKLIGER